MLEPVTVRKLSLSLSLSVIFLSGADFRFREYPIIRNLTIARASVYWSPWVEFPFLSEFKSSDYPSIRLS